MATLHFGSLKVIEVMFEVAVPVLGLSVTDFASLQLFSGSSPRCTMEMWLKGGSCGRWGVRILSQNWTVFETVGFNGEANYFATDSIDPIEEPFKPRFSEKWKRGELGKGF